MLEVARIDISNNYQGKFNVFLSGDFADRFTISGNKILLKQAFNHDEIGDYTLDIVIEDPTGRFDAISGQYLFSVGCCPPQVTTTAAPPAAPAPDAPAAPPPPAGPAATRLLAPFEAVTQSADTFRFPESSTYTGFTDQDKVYTNILFYNQLETKNLANANANSSSNDEYYNPRKRGYVKGIKVQYDVQETEVLEDGTSTTRIIEADKIFTFENGDVAELHSVRDEEGLQRLRDYTDSKMAEAPFVTTRNEAYVIGETRLDSSLDSNVNVTVVNQDGNKYVFNGLSAKDYVFTARAGTYTFNNVPEAHPIAFHTTDNSVISYTGTSSLTKTAIDGQTRNYYYGTVTLTVNGNFNVISYECYYHGYMGGQNGLKFDTSTPVTTTPSPTTAAPAPVVTTLAPAPVETETTSAPTSAPTTATPIPSNPSTPSYY